MVSTHSENETLLYCLLGVGETPQADLYPLCCPAVPSKNPCTQGEDAFASLVNVTKVTQTCVEGRGRVPVCLAACWGSQYTYASSTHPS